MSIKSADELGLDLFETQTVFGVTLLPEAAHNIIGEVERRWKHSTSQDSAFRQALEVYGVSKDEWEPWKFLLGRVFGRRGLETQRQLKIPFAPR